MQLQEHPAKHQCHRHSTGAWSRCCRFSPPSAAASPARTPRRAGTNRAILGRRLHKRRDQNTVKTSEKHQVSLCGLLSIQGGCCQVTWTRWYASLWLRGQRWPGKPSL